MKIAIVRIEDNTAKIEELKALEEELNIKNKRLSEKLDDLHREIFMQILAYIKCATEDYYSIGDTGHRLSVYDGYSRTVNIQADLKSVYIDFNYMGTRNVREQPDRMIARFSDNNIQILKSSKKGIHDLLHNWAEIKPEFQKKIDKAIENRSKKAKSETAELEYMLETVKKFKV